MAHSFATAPNFYLSAEVEATALARMREGLLAKVEAAAGARLTVTDILLKVCAQALAEFPDVNVAWAEDAAGGGIVRHIEVNVGLAVSVGQDGILPHSGLVVPVLLGADRLTLGEIARRRSDLVGRARGGKLTLTDLEGGAFTLSNLGMYGVDEFHAILNPPQAAILAVGRKRSASGRGRRGGGAAHAAPEPVGGSSRAGWRVWRALPGARGATDSGAVSAAGVSPWFCPQVSPRTSEVFRDFGSLHAFLPFRNLPAFASS